MVDMTRALARSLVDDVARDIDHGVNIMDREGRIVASSDPSRVGEVHDGAVEALRSGRAVEVEVDSTSTRAGVNQPIVWDGQRIGVVGITGPLEQVRPLARVVRSCVLLLVRREQELVQAEERRAARADLCERLVRHVGAYPAGLVAEASAAGLDLQRPHAVVLASGRVRLPAVPGAFALTPAARALACASEESVAAVTRSLADAPGRVAVGPRRPSLAESLHCAEQVRVVADALALPEPIVRYDDLAVLCALSETRVPERRSAIDALAGHPELLETLRVLVRHNANPAQTAAALHVHRNTLAYRLERIEALTGRSPRRLVELLDLVYDLVATEGG